MFLHHCTACERRQLIFPSQVRGVSEVDGASGLAFTCWCGAEQVAVLARDVATTSSPATA